MKFAVDCDGDFGTELGQRTQTAKFLFADDFVRHKNVAKSSLCHDFSLANLNQKILDCILCKLRVSEDRLKDLEAHGPSGSKFLRLQLQSGVKQLRDIYEPLHGIELSRWGNPSNSR